MHTHIDMNLIFRFSPVQRLFVVPRVYVVAYSLILGLLHPWTLIFTSVLHPIEIHRRMGAPCTGRQVIPFFLFFPIFQWKFLYSYFFPISGFKVLLCSFFWAHIPIFWDFWGKNQTYKDPDSFLNSELQDSQLNYSRKILSEWSVF